MIDLQIKGSFGLYAGHHFLQLPVLFLCKKVERLKIICLLTQIYKLNESLDWRM